MYIGGRPCRHVTHDGRAGSGKTFIALHFLLEFLNGVSQRGDSAKRLMLLSVLTLCHLEMTL